MAAYDSCNCEMMFTNFDLSALESTKSLYDDFSRMTSNLMSIKNEQQKFMNHIEVILAKSTNFQSHVKKYIPNCLAFHLYKCATTFCCDLDKLLEIAYDAINNGDIDFQFEQYIFSIQSIENADKQVSTKFFDSKYSDKKDYSYSKTLQWSQKLCSILDINNPIDSKDGILKSNVSNELSNHLKNCLNDFCLRRNREYDEIRQTFNDIIKQKDIELVEESLLNLFGYEEIEFISYILENLNDIYEAMKTGPINDKKSLNDPSDLGVLITDLPHVFDRRKQFSQKPSIGNYCLPPDSIFSLDSTRRVQTLFIPASLDTSFKEKFPLKSVGSLESRFLRNILCDISSLNVIQSILFETAFNTDENMLIAAPTGSGKTISAIICIAREIEKHLDEKGNCFDNKFKIIYIAPMKSLASEITATFCQMLKPLKALECTGDTLPSRKEIESSNIIVSTPEKWDIITRKSTGDTDLVSICKLLIIDEVHLLASDRGAVLESIVARLFIQIEKQQSKIRIVALSATLPNYIDIAKFLKIELQKGLFVFDDRFRSTPLDLSIIGISQKRNTNYSSEDILFNRTMLDIILDESREDKQSLVFVHSRNQTEKTARFIIDEISRSAKSLIIRSDDTDVEQKKLSKESFHSNFLQTAVTYRIGIHHAGMSRHDRNIVERLFRNKILKCLISTTTLAWGVNLPSHCVIIKNTKIYSTQYSSFIDIDILDVLQIFGRAARPQYHSQGKAVLICDHSSFSHYISELSMTNPIESQFLSHLTDNLNAEIACGNITSIQESLMWLKNTFFYARLIKNPRKYGYLNEEFENYSDLNAFLFEIIHNSLRRLDVSQMIRYDEKNQLVHPTFVGRISSHFYINHSTIDIYMNQIKNIMSEMEILDLICRSSEFSQIKLRTEELVDLQKLYETHCFYKEPLDDSVNDSIFKIKVLIQCHISRVRINMTSLSCDSNYIMQNISRLLRALFQLSLNRGWPLICTRIQRILLMIENQCWSHQSPLWQVISPLNVSDIQTMKRLDVAGKNFSIEDLQNSSVDDLKIILAMGHSDIQSIKKIANKFPILKASVIMKPITRSIIEICAEISFRVIAAVTNQFLNEIRKLWIWVEDPNNNSIHFFDSISFTIDQIRKNEPYKIKFFIPVFDNTCRNFYFVISSDKFLNFGTALPIDVSETDFPENIYSQTRILDIDPLPVDSVAKDLSKPLMREIYDFEFFNPIQTQCFHSLYNTDKSILIGAPTGSGKTILSQIAVFRFLKSLKDSPSLKCAVIAPMKAIVRQHYNEFQKRFSALGIRIIEYTGENNIRRRDLDNYQIIISTPEKFDASIGKKDSILPLIKLFIIDEVHLLAEERGAILESIVAKFKLYSRINFRIIALSTCLANPYDVASWITLSKFSNNGKILGSDVKYYNFSSNVRPVPLDIHISGFPGQHYCPRMVTMNKPIYDSISQYSQGKPVLVFTSSRRQTRLTASSLICQLLTQGDPQLWSGNLKDDNLDEMLDKIEDYNLKGFIPFGIGIHHAGMSTSDRSIVEDLFMSHKIQILIATATLAWGINLPAYLVILKGTEFYDAKTKTYVDYPITDVLQMAGRAGRPQFDTHGVVCIFVRDIKKSFYKTFLFESFPIESQLIPFLPDIINNEIYRREQYMIEDCNDFLKSTFLYRRILSNPRYYGLESNDINDVHEFILKLTYDTIEILKSSECIVENSDRSYSISFLGTISAEYYISHKSSYRLHTNLEESMSLADIMILFGSVHEFSEIPVRHQDDHYNSLIYEKVPLKVKNLNMLLESTKVFLLLQGCFSRVPWPVHDYETDLRIVLEQSDRILEAMLIIALAKKFLETSIKIVNLIQCIAQRCWLDNSMMLNYEKLTNTNLLNIPFRNLVDSCNGNTTRYFMISEDELNFVRKFPIYQLKISVSSPQSQKSNSLANCPKINLDEEHNTIELPKGSVINLDLTIEQIMGAIAYSGSKFKRNSNSEQFLIMIHLKEEKEVIYQTLKSKSGKNTSIKNINLDIDTSTPRSLDLVIRLYNLAFIDLDAKMNIKIDLS